LSILTGSDSIADEGKILIGLNFGGVYTVSPEITGKYALKYAKNGCKSHDDT